MKKDNVFDIFWVTVESILQKLVDKDGVLLYDSSDINHTKGGEQISIRCPFHEDNSPSMGINKKMNSYNCFVCTGRVWELKHSHKKSSVWRGSFLIHFIRTYFELYFGRYVTLEEIADFVEVEPEKKKLFISFFKNGKEKETKPTIEKKEEKNLKISTLREYLWNDSSYILKRLEKNRDISREEAKKTILYFYLWYDSKRETLTIPVFQDYYLKWIYGRKVKEGWWKYRSIKYFNKTENIFNYDEVSDYDHVILVEGPLNAIRLWSLWYKNVISLFWAIPYPTQIKKLNKFREITIWFDGDEAWKRGRKDLISKLPRVKTNVISTEGKKDAYDFNKEQIKKLLG